MWTGTPGASSFAISGLGGGPCGTLDPWGPQGPMGLWRRPGWPGGRRPPGGSQPGMPASRAFRPKVKSCEILLQIPRPCIFGPYASFSRRKPPPPLFWAPPGGGGPWGTPGASTFPTMAKGDAPGVPRAPLGLNICKTVHMCTDIPKIRPSAGIFWRAFFYSLPAGRPKSAPVGVRPSAAPPGRRPSPVSPPGSCAAPEAVGTPRVARRPKAAGWVPARHARESSFST